MNCPDCKDTKVYQGLSKVSPCKTCVFEWDEKEFEISINSWEKVEIKGVVLNDLLGVHKRYYINSEDEEDEEESIFDFWCVTIISVGLNIKEFDYKDSAITFAEELCQKHYQVINSVTTEQCKEFSRTKCLPPSWEELKKFVVDYENN